MVDNGSGFLQYQQFISFSPPFFFFFLFLSFFSFKVNSFEFHFILCFHFNLKCPPFRPQSQIILSFLLSFTIFLIFHLFYFSNFFLSSCSPNDEKPETIDIKFSDFDGVLYHISNLESKQSVTLSLSWKCFSQLKSFGAEDVLKKVYGDLVAPTQSGYDFTIKFDVSKLPAKKGNSILFLLKIVCSS